MANKPPPKTAVMANVTSALLVQHLSVRRGDALAVDDVSLEIRPLELHGLVGPNGAGKTTLLEAIAGLLPSVGDVLLGPVPVDREQRKQHIFYIPDGGEPFSDERVGDVLAFAAKSMRSDTFDEAVDRLEVRGLLEKKLRDLGKGERKRALVSLALLVPKGFVLVDEPFDGLELKQARSLHNVLRTSTNENRSLLVSLHTLADAERLCDRFTLLNAGRVVGAGQLHELRATARLHPGAALEEVFFALT